MADSAPVGLNRIERVLAYMIASSAGLSLVAIAAVFIARFAGQTSFAEGAWPTIGLLPLIGLPIAFLLVLTLLIVSIARRRRLGRDGGR